MRTFLACWNPAKFAWSSNEDLSELQARVQSGTAATDRWSLGGSTQPQVGDRLLFHRQGDRLPRGVFGIAVVTKDAYEDKRWDDPTRQTTYADFQWLSFLDPYVDSNILDVTTLSPPAIDVYWSTPRSGIEIEAESAAQLSRRWAEFYAQRIGNGATGVGPDEQDDEAKGYAEGQERRRFVVHRHREWKLRRDKLLEFKKQHGRVFCEVPNCGFDFEAVYGDVGIDFAEVHHIRPLAELDGKTEMRTEDLRVICANCHRMVHRGGTCRKIETLISKQ